MYTEKNQLEARFTTCHWLGALAVPLEIYHFLPECLLLYRKRRLRRRSLSAPPPPAFPKLQLAYPSHK